MRSSAARTCRLSPACLVIAWLLASPCLLRAGLNAWTPLGPLGPGKPSILSLSADPFEAGALYAITWGGIYKSADAGASWILRSSGIQAGRIRALAFDPQAPGTLFASACNNLYKSTDGAATWEGIAALPGDSSSCLLSALAVDRLDSNRLYAGGSLGILISDNGGQDWRQITAGLESAKDTGIGQVIASLRTPGTVFALAVGWATSGPFGMPSKYHPGGLFISRDEGEHWAPYGEGFPRLSAGTSPVSGNIYTLSVHPTEADLIYAGGDFGVFKSTDEGGTWQRAQSDPVPDDVHSLALPPDDPNTVYAAAYDATYRTTDGGQFWMAVLHENITTIVADPRLPRTVYAGNDSSFFKTTDGGATWSSFTSGFSNQSISYLAIDPHDPNTIHTNPLAVSKDGGVTWQISAPGDYWGIVDVVVDLENSNLLYGVGYGSLRKSTDGGQTWGWAELSVEGYLSSLTLDPARPGQMYAVGANVYRIDDRDQSVTLLLERGPETSLASLVLWPQIPGLLLTAGSVSVNLNENKVVLRSTDGGSAWNPSDAGLPEQCRVEKLAVNPLIQAIVLAGTSAGLFRSADFGATWAAIGLPYGAQSVRSLVFDPGSPTTAFLGTAEGDILISKDCGNTWAFFEPRFPVRSAITEILVIPGRDKRILVGTENNGVWEITQRAGRSLRDPRRPRYSGRQANLEPVEISAKNPKNH